MPYLNDQATRVKTVSNVSLAASLIMALEVFGVNSEFQVESASRECVVYLPAYPGCYLAIVEGSIVAISSPRHIARFTNITRIAMDFCKDHNIEFFSE